MPNYVLDSSAADVNNAINKVVNITDQPTAGNDNVVKSSGVKTYVDNSVASSEATLQTFSRGNIGTAILTDAFTITNPGNKTWTDITGLETSVTTKYTNPKFLINGHITWGSVHPNRSMGIKVQYKIDSSGTWTDFNMPTNTDGRFGKQISFYQRQDYEEFLDSSAYNLFLTTINPSVGTQVYFKVQFAYSSSNTGTIYINRGENDNASTDADSQRGVTTLIVQEL